MKQKKKMILLIVVTVLLMLVIIFVVGRSYGFFKYMKEGEKVNVITIKGIEIKIENEEADSLNLEAAYPVDDSEGLSYEPFIFTMTNTSSRTLSYSILVENDEEKRAECLIDEYTLCPELSTDNIKYSYKKNDGTYTEPRKLGDDNNIITSGEITANEEITSSIILWIDSEAGNEIMNKYFFGKIIITGEDVTE